MVIVFVLFVAFMLGLHMLKPRFKTKQMSSVGFFSELPPAKNDVNRPAIKPPAITPLFIIRMLAAIALLLSLLDLLTLDQPQLLNEKEHSQNLWLMLDTSASMTTQISPEQSNFSLAKQQIEQLLAQHIDITRPICIELSTFHSGHQQLGQYDQTQALLAQVAQLKPTTLGTDLNQLRHHILANKAKTHCPNPLMAVVSDQSAPVWVNKIERMVWKDVGDAVANTGFTKITGNTQRFNVVKQQITVEAGYWHKDVPTTLTVTDPSGDIISTQTTGWANGNRWNTGFEPSTSGLYRLKLSPGGAYALDDEVTINVTINPPFAVDWQLEDTKIKSLFGWQQSPYNASLRVIPLAKQDTSDTPTIYIMPTGKAGDEAIYPINNFSENDPLLADINFDVIEQLAPYSLTPNQQITPVLSSKHGVWVARHKSLNAVYLSALPQLVDTPKDKQLTTAFFNTLKALTNTTPMKPLYSLTDINHDKITTTHLPLHWGEGNTAQKNKSHGVISFAPQVSDDDQQDNQWILWFTIFALLMATERVLNSWGGKTWR